MSDARMVILVRPDGEILVVGGDREEGGRYVGMRRIEDRLTKDLGLKIVVKNNDESLATEQVNPKEVN